MTPSMERSLVWYRFGNWTIYVVQFRVKCGKRGRDRFFGVKKEVISERVRKREMGKMERRWWSLHVPNFMDLASSLKKPEPHSLFLLPTHWCFISCPIVLLAFCLSEEPMQCVVLLYVLQTIAFLPLSLPSFLPASLLLLRITKCIFPSVCERERESGNGSGGSMKWTLCFPRSCESISPWWETGTMSENWDHH